MNSVGAAQQKPAVPPTRLSVVQEALSVADIVLWQRGELAAWCRSQPSQPPVRTNGQMERNQIINEDGIARRVLATGTASLMRPRLKSCVNVWQRLARSGLTSLHSWLNERNLSQSSP